MAFKVGNNTLLDSNQDGRLENLYIDGTLVLDGDDQGNVTLKNVIFDAGISVDISANTTDELPEGLNNLYFSESRARNSISVLGDLSYDPVTGIISTQGLASSTTDDLVEGTSNLYFTDSRAQSAVANDIASGNSITLSSAQAYTDSVVNSVISTSIQTLTTDDISEGINLYYTDARVDARIPTAISTFTNDANYADETYVDTAINNLVGGASAAFDTLKEIQDAMSTDTELATAIGNLVIPTNVSDLTNDADYVSEFTLEQYMGDSSINGTIGNTVINRINTSLNTARDYTDDEIAKIVIPTIPTNVSAFTNDSGYLTAHQDLSAYALQTQLFSGSYTDLTNTPTIPTIPTNVSAFTNDSGYLTAHQDLSAYALQTQLFSGSYTDLTNTPTIPTIPVNISDFNNDVGYITSGDVDLTGYATESYVNTAVANVVDSAPAALDTLNELSAALGNDANFATTISTQIGTKADASDLLTKVSKSGDTMSGDLTFGNNDKINMGSLNNLQLYTTGSNSLIFNNAGDLYFYNNVDDRNIIFRTDNGTGGTANYIIANGATGGVELTHYGTEKLRTTANGITVSGNIEITSTPSAVNHAVTKSYVDTAVSNIQGFSGNYNDLTNKPIIPTVPTNVSEFTNDAGYLTSIGTINYNDLTNKPTIPSITGLASETYVDTAISNLINGAPAAFDTLKEISDAMATDSELSTAINNLSIPTVPTNVSAFTNDAGYVTTDTNTTYSAGNGIGLSTTTFSVSAGNGLTQEANGLAMSGSFTGTFTASGDVCAYSDRALKRNIQTIEGALDKVTQMRGVTFLKDGKASTGVIAQEIETVLPEVVHQDNYGMRSVAYGNIVGTLIEAIKEQQVQIEKLQSEIAKMKEK